MSLAKDDEVIETLASDRSDQPFSEAILPRRSRRNRLVSDTHSTNAALSDVAIDAIIISDEVTWRFIPRECLSELKCNPICGRRFCYVNPDQLSTVQPNDDESIKQLEPNGRKERSMAAMSRT